MSKQQLALGQVETIGLPTAVAAADAGAKSADVVLLGYELARGGGYVAVKFVGQVGAVKAAVAAAKVAATRVGKVARSSIIARPSDQIVKLVYSRDTVGLDPQRIAQILGEEAPNELATSDAESTRDPVAEPEVPSPDDSQARLDEPATSAEPVDDQGEEK
ncbi:BMC domain-containing protein [Aestuariimicrobium sp. p3-SID1156]|uniref:BMC domain-containing protein n=1 Tax=Aestuariimicrobium sp. p3-SID1156 TaxID=2916038 RepID=UPI00223B6292|nr:BMC domain-containing protein [Aestuariimicrobium sp. p3-SID1156]MCT1458344.1 BMC domain-containing protein [Aestuariimicrobium sp. p3-SID1156]